MGHTSRTNQRADVLRADQDHNHWALHEFSHDYDKKPPKFRDYHSSEEREPGTGYYDDFVMVAHDSDRGQVIRKDVEEVTITCDECDVAAIYDENSDPLCPECGMICNHTKLTDKLVRDERAAGRMDD